MTLYWPLENQKGVITQTFNQHPSAWAGLDIAFALGTKLLSPEAGKVTYVGWQANGYGYHVKIKHNNGYSSLMAHMKSAPMVKNGQEVKAGTVVGFMGSTGNSTGPHVHWEVRNPQGRLVDPLKNTYSPRKSPPVGGAVPGKPGVPVGRRILDINYQAGLIDAVAVRENGIVGVILQASSGIIIPGTTSQIDPLFKENAERVRNAGLLLGAYHTWHPSKGFDQFSYLFSAITGFWLDLPVTINVSKTEGMSKVTMRQLLLEVIKGLRATGRIVYSDTYKTWKQKMYEVYYKKYGDYDIAHNYPMVSTTEDFWNAYVDSIPEFDYVPLAFIKPGFSDPGKLSPWQFHTIQQFSNQESIPDVGATQLNMNAWNDPGKVPFPGDILPPTEPPNPDPEYPETIEGTALLNYNDAQYNLTITGKLIH